MKSNALNHWRIIRWATVSLFFIGTVAVLLDQLKCSQKDCRGLKAQLAFANTVSVFQKEQIERLEKYEKACSNRLFESVKQQSADLRNIQNFVGKTEDLRRKLRSLDAELAPGNVDEKADQLLRRISLIEEIDAHTAAGESMRETISTHTAAGANVREEMRQIHKK